MIFASVSTASLRNAGPASFTSTTSMRIAGTPNAWAARATAPQHLISASGRSSKRFDMQKAVIRCPAALASMANCSLPAAVASVYLVVGWNKPGSVKFAPISTSTPSAPMACRAAQQSFRPVNRSIASRHATVHRGRVSSAKVDRFPHSPIAAPPERQPVATRNLLRVSGLVIIWCLQAFVSYSPSGFSMPTQTRARHQRGITIPLPRTSCLESQRTDALGLPESFRASPRSSVPPEKLRISFP